MTDHKELCETLIGLADDPHTRIGNEIRLELRGAAETLEADATTIKSMAAAMAEARLLIGMSGQKPELHAAVREGNMNRAWHLLDQALTQGSTISRGSEACAHDWNYNGTDRVGSHKGEDAYRCSKCKQVEYRP